MSTRPIYPGSNAPAPGKLPITELAEMKRRGEKIVMVTAYDAPSARLADAAGVDLILVGDSAAMVVLGHESTVPATMEEMLMLVRAVTRGAKRPLVVGDMPFGSFQVSDQAAVENAIRLVKEGGAEAVKLEGGQAVLSRVRAIVGAGIPVMGHIGLTPQTRDRRSAASRRRAAPPRRRGSSSPTRSRSRRPAASRSCSRRCRRRSPTRITAALEIPTIGIGAGAGCDGQVLVWHDMLGLYEGRAPRFVKRYADLAPTIVTALASYADEVRGGRFPEEQHTYSIPAGGAGAVRGSRRRGRLVRGERDERRRTEPPAAATAAADRAPAPALDRADADEEQREHPEREADLQPTEDRPSGALVGAVVAEGVAAVERESRQPEDERERERREREREHAGATADSGAREPSESTARCSSSPPTQ